MELTTRAVRGRAATLTHVFLTGEDTPTDAAGSVTVTVTDPSGATVASGTATHGDVGTYTFVLGPQPALTVLTVAWAATVGGFAVTELDACEVAGGVFFTIPQIRASDPELADTGKFPTAALIRARLETELECEQICGRAFVPRYGRVVVDGTGTSDVLLGKPDVRVVRAASTAQRYGLPFTALTPAQLAAVAPTSDGMLRRTDAGFWPDGVGNILFEFEFGMDAPPTPLAEAALVRLRSLVTKHLSAIPDRASSFTANDGGTYRLTLPKRNNTGIPDVDAVYARYGPDAQDGTSGNSAPPASRQLNLDPQWSSLFHGGVR